MKDINDDLTKEITIKKMSEEYDIPIDLLKRELEKVSSNNKKEEEPQKKLAKKHLLKYDIAAQNIIYFMMNDGKYIKMFQKELGYFKTKEYRTLANEIIYYYETNNEIDVSSFISYIASNEALEEETKEIICNVNIEELNMDVFRDFINVANKEMAKDEITELKEKIATEMDANKKLELAKKLVELKKGCVGYEK
jgi:hypothetical protein